MGVRFGFSWQGDRAASHAPFSKMSHVGLQNAPGDSCAVTAYHISSVVDETTCVPETTVCIWEPVVLITASAPMDGECKNSKNVENLELENRKIPRV